jgi:hypothetical protein
MDEPVNTPPAKVVEYTLADYAREMKLNRHERRALLVKARRAAKIQAKATKK